MTMKKGSHHLAELTRTISLSSLVFYGVGTILGAGVFVVIGEVIDEAGRLAPVTYAIAGLIAFATALSYAEISARVPTAGGPIDYVEKATGNRTAGSVTGWMLMTANTVSAATITAGFVGYLGVFADIPAWVGAIAVVAVLGFVAAHGMKTSTGFMAVTTLIGIATLLAVLWATRHGLGAAPDRVADSLKDLSPFMTLGLFAGTFLALYSFIGFGDMALTAEEVKEVERTMPRAIVIAFIVVFVFYVLVSSALIGAGPTEAIASSKAPLVAAVEREGWLAWPIGIASLFVIVNGALTQMIGASRLLMDIGRDRRGAPEVFARINSKTGTPLVATAAIAVFTMSLATLFPLKTLAEATSLVILIVFVAVNASLILLKRRDQPDDVPNLWIGVPIFGAATCTGAVCLKIVLWMNP